MDKVFIIAEAGVNHNGSIEMAKKLIDAAYDCGADAVKFQSFKAETLVTQRAQKASYQKITTGPSESQYDMIKKLELDYSKHELLMSYCNEVGIKFMSSPFDLESIDLLDELGLDLFKIPSGEITNTPYLRKIAKLNKKIILSTGMSTIEEIEFALSVLNSGNTKEIFVLHCNTEYPTPMQDVNLLAMNSIKERFNVKIGYSDHTLGIEISIAAVALGAKVIEKHFTLDKDLPGPDHRASLEPEEFVKMVKAIRNIEQALGNGIKAPSNSEIQNKSLARKSIVAATNISKGEIFTEENLTVKRPGDGISPMFWDNVIGKRAEKDYLRDELIEL